MDIEERATAVIAGATTFAAGIGVDMVVEWQEDQRRLTFTVDRRGGAPGSGASAIRRLLAAADAQGIEVAIDVLRSIPALIRYYWQFGFRAFSDVDDDEGERRGLAQLETARSAFLARPGVHADDFGVTFMWRERPGVPTTMVA